MSNNLNELQAMMLDMMKWFHNFCINHGIKYYMIGGTMLGAVRHKGFIPWDDDIDVGIPRRDYDRLLYMSTKLIEEESRYRIESYKDGHTDFQYSYAKLYDTSTTLVENRKIKIKRGIFIDIFPLDGIEGNSKEEAISNFQLINKKLNMLALCTCEPRKGRKWWKNVAVKLIGILPNRLFNPNRIIGELESLCKESEFDSSAFVGNLLGQWREREVMPRSFFGNPILYSFEDAEFFGVEDPENYLKNVYGDWRKLPPEDKRKTAHDYVLLDLKNSYFD